jgi:hypothetical protein
MRRLFSISALALFLTVPVWAQRGGGHAGGFGSGRGGFGGARGFSAAHAGGSHFSGGMRAGSSRAFSHGFNSTGRGSRGNRVSNCFGAFCGHPGLDSSSWGGGHFNVRRRGNQFSNCFGAFCGHDFNSNRGFGRWGRGWGWGWGWGYYDPWLWSSWDYDDYRFDRDYYRGFERAREWNEQNLAEIRMRQQEDADREDDAYARRSYSRQSADAPPSDPGEANATPTLLIFRDQHQKEVTNYAIVGQTLWNFTPQRKEKIPLADLDLAATVKANDDRGVPFSVPGPQQGQ